MDLKNKLASVIVRGLRALGINTPGLETYFAFGGGQGTATGVRINENNALTISAVYQCVRYISDSIGKLPLAIYKEVPNGKEKAKNHALYRVLHRAPNPFMGPSIFKKTMQGHLCLWGNAYAEIERNGRGQVIALWPLRPDRMRLQLFNDKIYYYYTTPDGEERQLTNVLHLRGLSNDGLVGYSPIMLQREKLGLSKASEQYRARFFANDARPGGVLQTDRSLGDVAYQRLSKFWAEEHQGLSNRGRMAILEDGIKWQDVGVHPDDAQFIEGEKFTKADIAAMFGVPPYKIGVLESGTVSYASVEQQATDADSECVVPYVVCWEDCLNLALLTPTEQEVYFTKFTINALMRADSAARAAFYQSLFNMAAISPNEIRQFEDMNTLGPEGDRRYVALNMIPVDLVDDVIKAKLQPPARPPAGNSSGDTPTEAPKLMNGAAH